MFHQHMPSQCRTSRKPIHQGAFCISTFVTLGFEMGLSVAPPIASIAEPPSTVLTHKWFLSCVSSQVPFQSVTFAEAFAASRELARVRFNPQVLLGMTSPTEFALEDASTRTDLAFVSLTHLILLTAKSLIVEKRLRNSDGGSGGCRRPLGQALR